MADGLRVILLLSGGRSRVESWSRFSFLGVIDSQP